MVEYRIGGDTLEYTGLATELLGGFLIAVAILVPLYTAIAGAALAFERGKARCGRIVFLFWLSQFALFRARRYRFTRTVFRGVTFDQYGSAWRFCLPFARVVGAGRHHARAGLSLAAAALERYKLRHTSFGDLTGSFAGSGATLFRRGLPIWLLIVAPIIVGFIGVAEMVDWEAFSQMLATPPTMPIRRLCGPLPPAALAVCHRGLVARRERCRRHRALSAISGAGTALVDRRSRFGSLSVASLFRSARSIASIFVFLGSSSYSRFSSSSLGAARRCCLRRRPARDVERDQRYHRRDRHALGLRHICARSLDDLSGRGELRDVAARHRECRRLRRRRLDGVRAAGAPSSALGEGLVDALGVGGI